jgi:hypothetical protein
MIQSSGRLHHVELTLQPHGALVIPCSACSHLALVPGGAACVIVRQMDKQWDFAVAVLCSVCPSFPSNVIELACFELHIMLTHRSLCIMLQPAI